ncbi:unnamed protein product [Caenorhabditis angaria]|uniref:Saposin B-type domain-containing protein n=1 Tax=Caenorhabditis angaria TaxID=860376 RepID=A0A9P1NAU5_9PELO|nr:unnamed protein product [Caenorhabditis angaria]
MKFVILLVLACLAVFTTADLIECQMCEMSVKMVVPMLGEDTNTIKQSVDAECKKEFHAIPFATQKCKKFVDEKLQPIINELENGTAPKDVCKKLSMC